MTKQQHTPTPNGTLNRFNIWVKDGAMVAPTADVLAVIVRAVNAHSALVEALEIALDISISESTPEGTRRAHNVLAVKACVALKLAKE